MTTDLHTLSGAYVLDAVSAQEAEEFGTHLAACSACRQEVRELQEVVARMSAAEVMSPPAELKQRVLAAVDREPQQPPAVRRIDPESMQETRAARSRVIPRLLAAAAALVAITAGVFTFDELSGPDSNLAADVTEVFDAEDTQSVTQTTSNEGTVTVAVSESLNRMAVDTDELPTLDDQRVYQLWTVTDDETTSRGVLSDPEAGASMPLPGEDATVAITIEPRGGSEQPTTPAIVSVEPSQV